MKQKFNKTYTHTHTHTHTHTQKQTTNHKNDNKKKKKIGTMGQTGKVLWCERVLYSTCLKATLTDRHTFISSPQTHFLEAMSEEMALAS